MTPPTATNNPTEAGDDVKEATRPFLEARPALGPGRAVLMASPSKSATHRAILVGALTPHTIVHNALLSQDTVASIRLAIALGARVTAEATTAAGARLLDGLTDEGSVIFDAIEPDALEHAATMDSNEEPLPKRWRGIDLVRFIAPFPTRIPRPLLAARIDLHIERYTPMPSPRVDEVDLENSGTTLRLGTAIASLADKKLRLTGDASLMTRPMKPLLDALANLGATTNAEGDDGRPPITIQGPLEAGRTKIRGDVSSQYISALIIAGQRAPGPVQVDVTTPLRSRPYVMLTQQLLELFKGKATITEPRPDTATKAPDQRNPGPTLHIPGKTELQGRRYTVPGDYSSAAFPLVAVALTGGTVCMAALEPDAVQGDKMALETLEAAGCTVTWEADPERPNGHLVTVEGPKNGPRAFTHSFTDTPDLFPALAALAACSKGTSRLIDAAHVRLKECDRVAAMANGLRRIGIKIEETDDTLTIHGRPDIQLPETTIEAHDDHRILMAFTVLAMRGPGPLYITDPGCYHVSYPRFRSDLDLLGAETRVVDLDQAFQQDTKETPDATGSSEDGA